MPIQFYNTLTKKKDEFKSIDNKTIRMYVCGPTVYDYFHIGNARSFMMSDVIRRYFEYRGYDVNFVMNITDVDDKIIKKANEQNKTSNEVASEFTIAFLEDIGKLGIKKATTNPKATENIKEIIDIIEKLVSKGIAYQLGNDVYYSIDKFIGYGKLSGKNIDDLISGARVGVDETKKNPLDFALWKGAKEGEPFWESPWGKGRPGWHIECSAMAMRYLGETIDIHCGGNDLIFPHHENEIAQSEACNGKPFANYWIHFGFLNIDNEKMSKSLGNFFTARDMLNKYSANALRFYYLQTHYASPLNFTHEGLEGAKNGCDRLNNSINELKRRQGEHINGNLEIDITEYENRFIEAMDDDFNSPKGMSVLFDLVKHINVELTKEDSLKDENIKTLLSFFDRTLNGVFGLAEVETDNVLVPERVITSILSEKTLYEEMLGKSIDIITKESAADLFAGLIDRRKEAKKSKNWKLADQIRDELKKAGVTLEDRKDGSTIWKAE
jgi:cysteinyl-tRNA synthetase